MNQSRAIMRLTLVLCITLVVLAYATRADAHDYATVGTARGHAGCQRINQAFLNQGASVQLADWFAYKIAPRESGCVPQYVKNRTDWSYSTVGLNGRTAALRRGWMRLCGHDVRTWAGYEEDAKCAIAAYKAMGTRPWRATR